MLPAVAVATALVHTDLEKRVQTTQKGLSRVQVVRLGIHHDDDLRDGEEIEHLRSGENGWWLLETDRGFTDGRRATNVAKVVTFEQLRVPAAAEAQKREDDAENEVRPVRTARRAARASRTVFICCMGPRAMAWWLWHVPMVELVTE